MNDPTKKLADLWRRALDPSTTEDERAACLKQMVRLARRADLVDNVACAIQGLPRPKLMDEIIAAKKEPEATARLLAMVEHNAGMLAYNNDADIEAIPLDLRPETLDVIMLAAGWGAHALKKGRSEMPLRLRKAIRRLSKALQEYRGPSRQKREWAENIGDDLSILLASEGEIGGADATAKRLGVRASDVRAALNHMIETGLAVPVGNGRARRYRWGGARLR